MKSPRAGFAKISPLGATRLHWATGVSEADVAISFGRSSGSFGTAAGTPDPPVVKSRRIVNVATVGGEGAPEVVYQPVALCDKIVELEEGPGPPLNASRCARVQAEAGGPPMHHSRPVAVDLLNDAQRVDPTMFVYRDPKWRELCHRVGESPRSFLPEPSGPLNR